jgi:hypothetical protein
MSKCDETTVANLISLQLGVAFAGKHFSLKGWGKVDDYAILGDDRYLFLEVENSQHHPDTNVLKLWPFLKDHPTVAVVLVQAFFPHSKCFKSSRGRLGSWVGAELEGLFPGRFKYQRVVVAADSCAVVEGLEKLRASLGGDG